MNNLRILITGGAGYLGSILTRKCLSKGHKVRVLDDLWYGDQSIQECQKDDLSSEIVKSEDKNEMDMTKIKYLLSKVENISSIHDKNGMNLIHVLLFNSKDSQWYVKDIESSEHEGYIEIIEAIFKKCSQTEINDMVMKEDNNGSTPLHYATIIDKVFENDKPSIALMLMKYGADKTLFLKDKDCRKPIDFINTENLRRYLDTKVIIKGPEGHEEQTAYGNIGIFQSVQKDKNKTKIVSMENLEKMLPKHEDLFDHHLISAMIW